MPKRIRTQHRGNELYGLAQQRHTAGWTDQESESGFQDWVGRNQDLRDPKAIAQARSEYQTMAHPRLSGWLPRIRSLAQDIMDKEPPGTSRRFNHEFVKICRIARDHKVSVSAALREIASRPSRRDTTRVLKQGGDGRSERGDTARR